MSIQQKVMVTVAEAFVTDDYQVELRVAPGATLTPDEAAQFADEVYAATEEAVRKFHEDQPRAPHGFDRELTGEEFIRKVGLDASATGRD
jgi:hypothetical protein